MWNTRIYCSSQITCCVAESQLPAYPYSATKHNCILLLTVVLLLPTPRGIVLPPHLVALPRTGLDVLHY